VVQFSGSTIDKDLEQEVRAIGKFLTASLATTGGEVIGSTLGYAAASQATDNSSLNPIASWYNGGLMGQVAASNTAPTAVAKAAVGEIAHAKVFSPLLTATTILARITDCLRGTNYSTEMDKYLWPETPGIHPAILHWVRPHLERFLTY